MAKLRGTIGVALTLAGALSPAQAQLKVTDFSGQWIGSGTDRATPMASPQQTRCRSQIKADSPSDPQRDSNRLSSETECTGVEGLHKRIRLILNIAGDNLTGSAEQTSTVRGSKPKLHAGPLAGSKTNDAARFEVRFPGLTPNAYVVFKLLSPGAFSMQVSSLGMTLTEVTFRRQASRATQ